MRRSSRHFWLAWLSLGRDARFKRHCRRASVHGRPNSSMHLSIRPRDKWLIDDRTKRRGLKQAFMLAPVSVPGASARGWWVEGQRTGSSSVEEPDLFGNHRADICRLGFRRRYCGLLSPATTPCVNLTSDICNAKPKIIREGIALNSTNFPQGPRFREYRNLQASITTCRKARMLAGLGIPVATGYLRGSPTRVRWRRRSGHGRRDLGRCGGPKGHGSAYPLRCQFRSEDGRRARYWAGWITRQ